MTAPTISGNSKYVDDTLRSSGLIFEWNSGIAILALRFANRPRLLLTVRHSGTVLQVIAHGVWNEVGDAQLIASRDMLSQAWGVGRIYYSERDRAWDASVALYAAQRGVAPELFRPVLASLGDAPDLVMKGHPPALIMPRQNAEQLLSGIHTALHDAGLEPSSRRENGSVSIVLDLDRMRVCVDWFVMNGTMVVARAMPVGASPVVIAPDLLARMNRLNGRLDIGGVGFDYDLNMPLGWIAHPIHGFECTSEVVRWTSERAASWAEAAYG
jgi:hypothetical protein